GIHPQRLKTGMELACDDLMGTIQGMSRSVTTPADIRNVARVSSNGDENMGDVIADAVDKVGPNGIITVSDTAGTSTTLEIVDGIRFQRGYTTPYFINDIERGRVVLDRPYILMSDCQFKTMQEILPVVE